MSSLSSSFAPIPERRKLRVKYPSHGIVRNSVVRRYIKEEISQRNNSQFPIPGIESFTSGNDSIKILWIVTFLVGSILLGYQSYSRISYYFTYPTTVDVRSVAEDLRHSPMWIVSTDTAAMANLWEKYVPDKWKTGIIKFYCINPLLTLLKSNTSGSSLKEVWQATNVSSTFQYMKINARTHDPEFNFSAEEVPTIHGISFKLNLMETWKSSFIGNSVTLIFKKKNVDFCEENSYLITMREDALDFTEVHFTHPQSIGSNLRMWLFYKQFIFVDVPNLRCVDDDVNRDCAWRCIKKTLMKLKCKLPFADDKVPLPHCQLNSAALDSYVKVLEIVFKTDVKKECGCERKCQKRVYEMASETRRSMYPAEVSLTMEFRNNEITVLRQRLVYDMIAFFSEFGGNIGLFWGLSITSIIDCALKAFNRVRHYRMSKRKLPNTLNAKVEKSYTACLKTIADKKSGSKSVWYFFLLLIAGLDVYIAYDRISRYLNEPTRKTVELSTITHVQYPTLTVCGESKHIMKLKKTFKQAISYSGDCSQIQPPQLIDEKTNADQIWGKMSVHDELTISNLVEYFTGTPAEIKYEQKIKMLPLGNCTEITSAKRKFFDQKNFVFQILPTELFPHCNRGFFWHFATPPGEPLDLSGGLDVVASARNTIYFRLSAIKRYDSSRSPCVDGTTHFDCKNACFLKKFRETKTCTLPYMDIDVGSNKKCNTSEKAVIAHKNYLKIYLKSKPFPECNCLPRCEEINYNTRIFNEILTPKKRLVTVLMHFFRSNFVEVFVEILAYPIQALVSDIGSILSFGLGFSLLSAFELGVNFKNIFPSKRRRKSNNFISRSQRKL